MSSFSVSLGFRIRRRLSDGLKAVLATNREHSEKMKPTRTHIQLVKEIYAAGAVQVLAVEIDSYDEGENTGKLVIELPTKAQDREMVLGIAGKIAESQGFDSEPYNGQRFVFVMLDWTGRANGTRRH